MKRHAREGGLRTPFAPAILVLAMAAMSAAVAQQKTTVVLGTATQGGGFQIYGAAYSAALNESDPTLVVEQRSTKGSTENAPLLAEGEIDIGLLTGEVTYEALAGIGRAPVDLKIINAMYPNSGMFMVRGDSPYRTIADLKGKPIAWGASGSGFVVLARYVFDGRAAAQWGGGVGWPGFVAISNGPAGARFITPDAEGMKRILAKYPFIKPITLPAGSYKGKNAPVAALGSWSLVLARPGLPEEAAYKLARAVHKGEAALGAKLEQAKESTLANTLASAPQRDLIHPGVLKYMREAGILK